jgi:hypothetical protein
MPKSKSRTKKTPKRVLTVPDLEHANTAVLYRQTSASRQLHMTDRGEDPTDCLFDVADEFLLSVPRGR